MQIKVIIGESKTTDCDKWLESSRISPDDLVLCELGVTVGAVEGHKRHNRVEACIANTESHLFDQSVP